jgi:hypothetical protein
MRVSEDRYARDLRRLNLAQRLIQHEVRTQWICALTGFSEVRVRHLFHAYHRSQGHVRRHRGPAPTRVGAFIRSPTLRAEASAIGGIARVLAVVPLPPTAGGRLDRFGVEGAERLCGVFEVYRQVVPESRFTMDQFIRLVIALTEGQEFEIGHCRYCHGALLLDRMGDSRRVCPACREDSPVRRSGLRERENQEEGSSAVCPSDGFLESRQQSLF